MAASPSSARRAFADHVVDLLRGLGPVSARSMFGGHGLYLHGQIFALLVDARLYIKVDADSLPVFTSAGCPPFTYEARGRRVSVPYHEAPSEALEHPDEAVRWARLGLAAAQRALASKRAKQGRQQGRG